MSAGSNRGSDRFATAGRQTTDTERAAAARLITRVARGADDREQLLAALGLRTQTSEDQT